MIKTRHIRSRSLRSRLLTVLLRLKLKPKFTGSEFDHLRFRDWLEANAAKRKLDKSVAITSVNELFVKGEWHIPADAKADSSSAATALCARPSSQQVASR
jgi:hypothetical protein